MKAAVVALLVALTPGLAGAVDPHEFNIFEEIEDFTATTVKDEVKKAKDEKAPEIVIHINSPRGSILSGLDIISTLRLGKIPTRCVVEGVAASMAAVIFEACDKRQVQPYAVLLFHEGLVPMTGGRVRELNGMVNGLKAMNHAIAVLVSKRLGMTVAEYEEKVAQGDWWLTSDTIMAARAADEVLP
jgi:ATP-dependent Clp protease protease subunit